MPTLPPPPSPVTVIGLGSMGRALAGAFIAAGHPTIVWNRTSGRAGELVAAGAIEATTVAEAIDSAALTVVCILDRAAVEAVLDAAGGAVRDATIVNLTSSTPEDARAIADRAAASGASFLAGTIMVPTAVIGTDDTLVLYSGNRGVFAEHERTLRSLGGDADLLGSDAGLAATYDLGMLDIFFNGMAAFLHASALVGVDGVSAMTFLPYAKRMLALLDGTFAELAADVDAGEHPGTEDNLEMELAFLDHIVEASEARGLDTTLPAVPRAFVHSAISAGHGHDGFSRIIDVLRPSAA